MYKSCSFVPKIEKYLAENFLKLPFPNKLSKYSLKIIPLIAIYGVLTSLPFFLIFTIGSLGATIVSFFVNPIAAIISLLFFVASVIALYFQIKAIRDFKKDKLESWNELFIATLISGLGNILTFNIFHLAINTLPILYVLFNLKKFISESSEKTIDQI